MRSYVPGTTKGVCAVERRAERDAVGPLAVCRKRSPVAVLETGYFVLPDQRLGQLGDRYLSVLFNVDWHNRRLRPRNGADTPWCG